MLDRERVLAKIDQIEGYLRELREIVPKDFVTYQKKVDKRRACERLLQLSVEAVIDVCRLLVTGLRLGIPSEEDDLFEKLEIARIISPQVEEKLKEMKGFRNILVHEYTRIDDKIVYQVARTKLRDFEAFKQEILRYLQTT
jgi:uncharacterized protein YutE (UPF0331/DUF86 family)